MDPTQNADTIDDPKSDDDRQVDARAVLVVFTALVLGALHFVSGWVFDLHL